MFQDWLQKETSISLIFFLLIRIITLHVSWSSKLYGYLNKGDLPTMFLRRWEHFIIKKFYITTSVHFEFKKTVVCGNSTQPLNQTVSPIWQYLTDLRTDLLFSSMSSKIPTSFTMTPNWNSQLKFREEKNILETLSRCQWHWIVESILIITN